MATFLRFHPLASSHQPTSHPITPHLHRGKQLRRSETSNVECLVTRSSLLYAVIYLLYSVMAMLSNIKGLWGRSRSWNICQQCDHCYQQKQLVYQFFPSPSTNSTIESNVVFPFYQAPQYHVKYRQCWFRNDRNFVDISNLLCWISFDFSSLVGSLSSLTRTTFHQPSSYSPYPPKQFN